jgi:hypothetical protein
MRPQESTGKRRNSAGRRRTLVCGQFSHWYAERLHTSVQAGWTLVSAMAAHQCRERVITSEQGGCTPVSRRGHHWCAAWLITGEEGGRWVVWKNSAYYSGAVLTSTGSSGCGSKISKESCRKQPFSSFPLQTIGICSVCPLYILRSSLGRQNLLRFCAIQHYCLTAGTQPVDQLTASAAPPLSTGKVSGRHPQPAPSGQNEHSGGLLCSQLVR